MVLRKAKHTIQEFALIRAIERRFARGASRLVRGIGDDAAVIAASPPMWWHLTTDLLAEGVHFDLNTASPKSVGYRAAMANLSDIAAMGAVPRYLLTSLAIPKTLKSAHIYELYEGLMKACRLHGVRLIGGDTSASKAGLFLSITLIGTTAARRALFRHGAHVGDRIYVTGTLGDSLAGLQLLTGGKTPRSTRRKRARLSQSQRHFLVNRHLHPTARLAEGQWLNNARLATAAIDLSDGLSGDLRHICEESRVGAELDLGKIPISTACRAYAERHRLQPAQLALTGGEDYELLFTVPSKKQSTIERQARARGYRVTCIGTIRPHRFGIQMTSSDGTRRPIPMTSYEHFR
ncbi:MAG: thiamine-phosphate kinase [Nitrospira sp.]|nr:MAG: thiamine-phosphate kinase [Nitrospira sp.]